MVLSRRSTGHWLRARHVSRALYRPRPYSDDRSPGKDKTKEVDDDNDDDVRGAMTRRLEEATEDALLTGGRAGRRAIEDAGFNDELKNRLLGKIADAKFRDEYDSALREAGLVGSVPQGAPEATRHLASAQPWTGQESQSDAVLRMLNDAHKPLAPGSRAKPRIPSPSSIPVDMRIKRQPSVTKGRKAADARDAASFYVGLGIKEKDKGLSEKEREAMKKELRDRFTPAARAMPNTLSGLAALANERIEDAIARGQFKHIPRGVGVERDARADNPFIDTTEYIMNKMIKKQDIVPPWIEKQQELVKAATVFRARLRNDWKRHASRMIASRGGSLDEQMKRADEHARAEEIHNPRRRRSDQVAVPTNLTDDIVMLAIREEALPEPSAAEPSAADPVDVQAQAPHAEEHHVLVRPFRDAEWEAAERSYMELAITNLNSLTRAYNLMAPDLAKKPYFSLQRELNACFADVAPEIANEIKERARRPERSLLNQGGHQSGSLLDRFARESRSAKVYDSRTPHYGFKEMWKDFWQRSA